MKTFMRGMATSAICAVLCAGCGGKTEKPLTGTFDSPGAAAVEFAEAVRAGDKPRLAIILGQDADMLVNAGDPVQGDNERRAFLQAYDSQRVLVPSGENAFILEVGGSRWPLSIPIVKAEGGWKFDTQASVREMLLRRIGRNELAVLGTLRGIAAAQQEYKAQTGAYATRLRSEPGKKNGLYWETAAGEPESPAGRLLAWAEAEGYAPGGDQPKPYHGYLYRRLEVKDPKNEFAILAYPSDYRYTGIKTFVISQDGAIYAKDLDVHTTDAAAAIKTFAPDESWTREP
jgi:hypothetical protein